MPKRAKELTDRAVKSIVRKAEAGFFPVGGTGCAGLAVQVKNENSASWILRVSINGKRRDIGLGSFGDLTLAEAREETHKLRKQIRQGIDPIEERKKRRSELHAEKLAAVTFRDVAKQFVSKKRLDFKGKNVESRIIKLETQLETYIYPVLGNLLPGDIQLVHIKQVLDPIWTAKVETANRVRLHIEKIIDLAIVLELRASANPARWKGYLDQVYSKPSHVTKTVNHPALPFLELPEFIKKLRSLDSLSAAVLEFQILTAARPGETRAARWDQIDLEARTWTISGDDMKEGKQHVVPLCSRLVNVLTNLPRESELIFPSTNGKQISDVAVSKVAKKLYPGVTAHGFRSTFKDWARKLAKHHADEVSELALAHVSSDSTRAAYARDTLLEERRALMREFELYCAGIPEDENVISMKRA